MDDDVTTDDPAYWTNLGLSEVMACWMAYKLPIRTIVATANDVEERLKRTAADRQAG